MIPCDDVLTHIFTLTQTVLISAQFVVWTLASSAWWFNGSRTHDWLLTLELKETKWYCVSSTWMDTSLDLFKGTQASCFSPWEAELSRRTSLPFSSVPRLLNCRGTAEVPESKCYCEVMEIYRAVIESYLAFKSYQSDRTDESTWMPPNVVLIGGKLGICSKLDLRVLVCLLRYLYYSSKVCKILFYLFFSEEISYSHQGCIFLINTVKTVILWNNFCVIFLWKLKDEMSHFRVCIKLKWQFEIWIKCLQCYRYILVKNEPTYIFWPVLIKMFKRKSAHTKFDYILNY